MQTEKPKHQMFYTEAEISLIKATFCENDELIRQIRNFFLELSTKEEDANVKLQFTAGSDAYKLLKKTLLPELDGNAPMFQLMDLLLPTEIKGKTADTIIPDIAAREIMIDYLNGKFDNLCGMDSTDRIAFAEFTNFENKTSEQIHHELFARNNLISLIELQLQKLLILAGKKEDVADQKAAKIKKDSSK